MKKIFIVSIFLFVQNIAHAAQVGEINYARGAVIVQKEDGSGARLIGIGDILHEGEVIKTGPNSFAILTLKDETKMTLRPKTSFAVEEMTAKKDNTASALLRLFRGGMRTITGFISKHNKNGFKVKTSIVTMGIRGTEFDARLCEQDCADENKKLEQKYKDKLVIARIVFKRGSSTAVDFAENKREIELNSPLYEGDTVKTGDDSYLVIVFRDKSRTTLQSNTDFRIDELKFIEGQEEDASSFFSLLRGGLRTVTGLIGKFNPKNYRMRTAVATMGIRGTGYDLLCTGTCISRGLGAVSVTENLPEGDGLYAHVWDGSITVGAQVLATNQAGYVAGQNVIPVVLPEVPRVFINNLAPRPGSIDTGPVDFSKFDAQDVPPGLYVSVKNGLVTLGEGEGKEFGIKPGQAAYAGKSGEPSKLATVPAFQARDPYPSPGNFNPNNLNFGSGGLGSGNALCEI